MWRCEEGCRGRQTGRRLGQLFAATGDDWRLKACFVVWPHGSLGVLGPPPHPPVLKWPRETLGHGPKIGVSQHTHIGVTTSLSVPFSLITTDTDAYRSGQGGQRAEEVEHHKLSGR